MGILCLDTDNAAAGFDWEQWRETSPKGDPAAKKLSAREWQERLPQDVWIVLRCGSTERPHTGRYSSPGYRGTFCCAGCGAALFESRFQFDSGTGWPSFSAADGRAVRLGLALPLIAGCCGVEAQCAHCRGHLGHLFDDGPPPTHQRYCINSVALTLNGERG